MSPRLVADLSDMTTAYTANKTLSDLSAGGIPVGQLLASTGSLSIFDSDQAFNVNNPNSLIKNFSSINLQIKFYEIIPEVNDKSYYVPIKTYYSEGFPETDVQTRSVSIQLRDLFFYFESMKAPQLFIRNASLSYIISTLMDSIGFTNYAFRRNENETEEPIIPNFIVRPDATVAQILNDLAISTQSAMFFDEYNNFIVMSRNRMMPTAAEYTTDITLQGSPDSSKSGIVRNYTANGSTLSNIINIASTSKDIYNDGKISYSNRYIQRSYGSLAEAGQLNKDKRWVYKPALLWEVSGTANVRSVNREFGDQSSYALGAIPLNTTLSSQLPYVDSNKELQRNVIDFGEAIYWLPRYKGYFYANAEIIRYDAVEYAVDGVDNVWISDVQEYEDYFQQLKFNGFIYPTGRVKIYAEPYYNEDGTLKEGAVAKHGRGQFGTSVTEHRSGLGTDWTNKDNMYGCAQDSKYLFSTRTSRQYNGSKSPNTDEVGAVLVKDTKFTNLDQDPALVLNPYAILDATSSGKVFNYYETSDSFSKASTVNGIIKNFLNSNYDSETPFTNANDSDVPGTMQSSALIFNGRNFSSGNPIDFISYIHKPLEDSYNHFGTRLRIIGKVENTQKQTTAKSQTSVGSSPMFTSNPGSSDEAKIVSGSSGGMGIMVNPVNNTGYFFEVVALTDQSTKAASGKKSIANVYFYKNLSLKTDFDGSTAPGFAKTIPVELYSGLTQILVDDGLFTGQAKVKGEQSPSVYDLSVEYEKTPSGLKFYLTINNNLIAIVEDTEPLPITQSVALFVRGSSRLMFENVYAIAQNDPYAASTGVTPVASAEPFDLDSPDAKYEQYGLNRVVKNTFLSNISASQPPQYKFYYDEFGTIMRECAYFNIKYDKAYPALLAKMSPTFNVFKGYSVSGFTPNAYGAEFMIFNTTDTVLNLDETSGNYLRIQGVTFTQESTHDLTLDEYFNKRADFSNPSMAGTSISPSAEKQTYIDLMNSRSVYGKKDFSMEAPYIQDSDTAYKLMDWMISRIMRPRRSVGIEMFAMPTIQLGDVIELNYLDGDGVVQISDSSSRFIVYNIEYSKDGNGPSMKVYLSEVI
jgi:hypothetical protein